MSADAHLRSFIDRVLRCREAEDAAKEDTKAVYADLAAVGFEKAIVGQVVNYLRKREKDGPKFAEQSEKFDLYLDAYDRTAHMHAHERTHRIIDEFPPHDDETGEIIEHHSSAAAPTPADEQAGAGSPPRAAPAANSNPPAPTSSPAEADKAGDATLLPASSANPIPDFVPAFLVADARPKPRLRPSRPNCLKPEACAGQGNRHCYTCEKAAAAKDVAFRSCETPKERVGA